MGIGGKVCHNEGLDGVGNVCFKISTIRVDVFDSWSVSKGASESVDT